MQAHAIMKKHVFKVKEDSKVRSVIELFIEHGISGLPVVNDRNEIVGNISDGDIIRFISKHKERMISPFSLINIMKGEDDILKERARNVLELNVMDIAQKAVNTVSWDVEVEDIASLLGKKQVKKLPVEREGVLVGIISRGDVIRSAFHYLL